MTMSVTLHDFETRAAPCQLRALGPPLCRDRMSFHRGRLSALAHAGHRRK